MTSLLLKEKWKTPQGAEVNPVEWLASSWEACKKNKFTPPTEIHIGSDTQKAKRSKLAMATVIAIRTTRGSKYIYFREFIPRKKFPEEGLWIMEEIQRSVEVTAELMERFSHLPIHIDFDINPEESDQFISNKYKSLAIGWARGIGLENKKIHIKPDNQIATKAADSHARERVKGGRSYDQRKARRTDKSHSNQS